MKGYAPTITRYRVRLKAEDGLYTLADGFNTYHEAEDEAYSLAGNYGDGQEVFVERYTEHLS